MNQKTETFGILNSLDGRRIPYLFEQSKIEDCKGAYLLLHGLGVDKNEYLGFYSYLSKKLAEEGFDVLAIDFPGHGDSAANPAEFTLVNCISDSILAANFLLSVSRSKLISIFGTSFGAGPAVITAGFFKEYLDRLTLLAPALHYKELYVEPTFSQRDKYKNFYKDSILHNAKISINDRLSLTWKNALEFSLIDPLKVLASMEGHTSIIHGDADSLVPCKLTKNLGIQCPGIDITIIKNMDHGFMDREDENGNGPKSLMNLKSIFAIAIGRNKNGKTH